MSKAKDALKNAFKTALYFLPFAHALKAMEWISSVTSATKLIFAKSLITGLTSKGTPALSQNFGAKLSFRSPTAPRQIIYGKARVGATIVFVETTGTDNYLLHMVMVFSGHEVEELVSVRFNDTNLTSTTSTINGSTVHTVTNSKYVNSDNENKLTSGGALIRYTFEDGSQTAANGFMAAQTSLTTNHKFKDCSYLYVQMAYDAEAFSGIPNISAVIKGKKCYDPRTGNTVWTDNPALHVRDYLSNTTYGLKATTSELNDANSSGGFWSAANICEQTVNLPDSATEQRYTGNGSTNMTARGDQVLEGLLSSMSGKLTYTNGKFNVFPGTAQTPSLSITDTELLSPMEIITNSTTGDLYNSVKPIFVDASTNYTPTDAPIYENSTFLSEDTPSGESNSNYVKRLEPNLAFTTTNTMAQRLGRIMLNDQRQTVGLSCLVSLKYMQLQPNDWVQITNSRLSYTNKNFQVVTTNLEKDGVPIAATRLELREIDSSIYTFGTSDYGTMVSEGTSVGTGDLSVSPPSGLAVSAELVVIGYDLEVTWTNNSSDAVQGTEIKYGTSSGTYIGSVTAGKGQSKIIVPNLKANTTYYVSARHFSSNNVFSSFTSEVTINTGSSSDIATPSAPSNLSVTTNKPLQIGVTWTSPSNTDTRAVKVYRKTSNVTPTDDTNLVETVACEPGTTQKVTYGKEDGLTAGTTYYFWVRAISFSEKHSAFAGSQSGTFGDVTGSDISTSTTITAGTGNNVGVLDGADSTYRIYAGHATPGSAPFRVTQAGVLTATNATITGNVTANSLNVTGATVTGTLDASVITLNGNALSGLMGSSGTGSSTVLAVGPDVKNQIKVGSSSVEYIAYDDVTEQGHKALDMQFGSTTYYPTASVTGWQSTIINPGNGSNTGYLSAPSYILQNAGSSVTSTTNRLYNLNGTLYWDGNVVGLGSGTITGVVAGTNLNGGGTSGSVTLNLDSTITGNHTFSNNVVIGGDLTVQGTTTTIDTTNLDVKDKNITLNYGSGDTSGNADGAGITIQDAVDASTNATLLWDASNDRFDFSHDLKIISTNRDMLHLRRNASSGDAGINFENTSGNLAQIYAMSTGNVVIDAVADITLDAAGNQIFFKDAGTTVGTVSMTDSNLKIISNVSDKDMIFAGTDGGSEVVALTLDMSNAGNAIFNSGGEFHGSLHLDADSAQLQLGDDNDMQVYHNGAHGTINVGTGNLTLDVAGDIALDADGGDIKFQDAGTDIFSIINSSSDVQLKAAVQDKDMQFRGNDDGTIITALTLDMSDAGTAIFNHDIKLADDSRVYWGDSSEFAIHHNANGNTYIGGGTVVHNSNTWRLMSLSDAEAMIRATVNSSVQLYYDNVERLATSSSGVTVTGNIANSSGDMTIDVAGDIILDADGGDIWFNDGGTTIGVFKNSSSHLFIESTVQDKDILIRGNDGGSTITAVEFDMSDAGTATFNHDIKLGSSGRIGIGIAPGEMLDIQSASGDARIRLDAPASSDTEIKFFNDGSAQYTIGHDDATDNFVIGGANVDAPMVSVNKSGNVGIGTNSPEEKLHVSGNILLDDADPRLYFQTGSSHYNWKIAAQDSTNKGFEISSGAADGDANSDTYTPRIVIEADTGDVGIGTTAPGSPLHVETADDQIADFYSTDTDGYIRVRDSNDSLYVSSDNAVGSFGGNAGANANNINISLTSGAVGIGTTSPDNKLHVQTAALSGRSASNGNTLLTLEHSTDTGIQFFSATQTQLRFGDAADTGAGAIIYTHSDNILRLSAASAHRFTIGGTEAMRIDSSGNVGIGTAGGAAGAKLHVLSGTDNNLSADVSEIRFIGADKAITGEQANLVIQTNDDMAANKGGSIGFGGRHTTSSTNSSNFAHISGRKENATSANFAGYLSFGTSDSASDIHERMRLASNGYLGIGTSSPSDALHVGDGLARISKNNGTSKLYIHRDGSNPTSDTELGGIYFAQDYDASSQDWAKIVTKTTTSSAVRTRLTFEVKSTSGNVMEGMSVWGTDSNGPIVCIGHTSPWTSTVLDLGADSNNNMRVGGTLYLYDSNRYIRKNSNDIEYFSNSGKHHFTKGAVQLTTTVEDGTSIFSTYNANTNPDAEQFYIEHNGSSVALGNKRNKLTLEAAGAIELDAAGDIQLDVGNDTIELRKDGTKFGEIINSSNDLVIKSSQGDEDIIFKGVDSSTAITALTLDMSDAGAATFNNNVTAYSDERLKDNIETLDGSKVLDMRGVSFTRDGKEGSGVIAQELEKIAPELVKTADDEMGTKSVAYGNLVGYLIEAVKSQQNQIELLNDQIKLLIGENNGD